MFGNIIGGVFDDVIDTAHSHVSGVAGAATDYVYDSINQTIDGFADNLYSSIGGDRVTSEIYYQQAKQHARQFMTTPFLQGWQWCIEADGAPFDFDIYVKDVDFGAGSIDADVFQIGSGSISVPTFSGAGEVSLTVRDHADLRVCKWFDSMMSRVKNPDGTMNLPKDYVFTLTVYVTNENGNKTPLSKMKVFALKKGNFALSRENGNTFMSVPLTFQKFTTVGNKHLSAGGSANSLGDIASDLIGDGIDYVDDFVSGLF